MGVEGLTDSLLGKQREVYLWRMSLHMAGQTRSGLLTNELILHLKLGTPRFRKHTLLSKKASITKCRPGRDSHQGGSLGLFSHQLTSASHSGSN